MSLSCWRCSFPALPLILLIGLFVEVLFVIRSRSELRKLVGHEATSFIWITVFFLRNATSMEYKRSAVIKHTDELTSKKVLLLSSKYYYSTILIALLTLAVAAANASACG